MTADTLGDRMKRLESVPRARLMPKTPVVLRLDGKAFHTFTRGLEKPHDSRLTSAMVGTMLYVLDHVQGARLGYVQSDEISILLTDYQSRETQPWFDYDLQKIVSVAASMASAEFRELWGADERRGLAVFDCRAWNLPLHEVANYFVWRQQDAIRNSVSGLAQSVFSSKQLHGVNSGGMLEMLQSRGVVWGDLPIYRQRGSCAYRGPLGWVVDQEIPVFSQDREYVEKWSRLDPGAL